MNDSPIYKDNIIIMYNINYIDEKPTARHSTSVDGNNNNDQRIYYHILWVGPGFQCEVYYFWGCHFTMLFKYLHN